MKKFFRTNKRRFLMIFKRIKNFSKEKVVVIGDSHTNVFNHINKNFESKCYFEVGYVSGATAIGAVNPNSKTNALKIFKSKIKRTSKNTPIIIQLGEVDCGFVIWFLAQKKNTTVKDQFNKSLNNYKKFLLEELINKGFKKIIVMSATLPTLRENAKGFGEIANLRKEVKVSQEQRTELTLNYNNALNDFCKQYDVLMYLDIDPYMLGSLGVIKKEFLNSDPLNHHNDNENYSKIIFKVLKKKQYLNI